MIYTNRDGIELHFLFLEDRVLVGGGSHYMISGSPDDILSVDPLGGPMISVGQNLMDLFTGDPYADFIVGKIEIHGGYIRLTKKA